MLLINYTLNLNFVFLTKSVNTTYVRPPRPIAVKKLIAKRVFLGLSRGKIPSAYDEMILKG